VSQGEKEWAAEHQWKESAGLLLPVNSWKRQTKYPLQERVEAQVGDACGGLSTVELSPAIILSESFAGH